MHTVFEPDASYSLTAGRAESCLLNGKRLYLGYNEGTLSLFQDGDLIKSVQLVGSIDSLNVIKELDSLVCLSGGNIFLVDLFSLEIQSDLSTLTKGIANCFAVDTVIQGIDNTLVTTLAIAAKRRLILLSWKDSQWQEPSYVNLPHQIRSMAFITPTVMILGHSDASYRKLSLQNLVLEEFIVSDEAPSVAAERERQSSALGSLGLASGIKKSGAYLGLGGKVEQNRVISTNRGEVILVRDNIALFVPSDGMAGPSKKRAIEYSSQPIHITVCSSFVVALLAVYEKRSQTSFVVKIHSIRTLGLVQSIELGTTAQPALISCAHGSKFPVFVLSTAAESASINFFAMQPWSQQIDQLTSSGKYFDALTLVESVEDLFLPDKASRRRKLQALHALQLFLAHRADEDWDKAIDTFIDLDMNPARVICLYPKIISGKLYKDKDELEELYGGQSKDDVIKNRMTPEEKPSSRPDSLIEADGTASPRPRARQRTIDPKSPYRKSLLRDDDTASMRSVSSRLGFSKDPESTPSSPKPEVLDEKAVFKRSVEVLLRYLTDRRQKVNKALSLLQPSVRPDPSSLVPIRTIEELFAIPNDPLPTLSADQIHLVAQMVDTALFRSYLAIRPTLLGSLCRLDNWCEVEEVEALLKESKKHNELLDLYRGKSRHEEALDLLKLMSQDVDDGDEKVEPTILYLQKLGPSHLDLICSGSRWVFDVNPARAIEIFTADIEEVERLPRHAVAKRLEAISTDALQVYLRHVIFQLGETGPDFHDKLAASYLMDVKAGKDISHERLVSFLRDSTSYRPERLLSHLAKDELDGIRAILLGRMGQHETALSIYVNKLENNAAAEQYCVDLLNRDPTVQIFSQLFKLYLQPKSSSQPRLKPALALLSRHGNKIAIEPVLDMLPPLLSVQEVLRFLVAASVQQADDRNHCRLLRETSRARLDQLQRAKIILEGEHVTITDGRACPVCQKRIGNSVIAVHKPNGIVTHFSQANVDSDSFFTQNNTNGFLYATRCVIHQHLMPMKASRLLVSRSRKKYYHLRRGQFSATLSLSLPTPSDTSFLGVVSLLFRSSMSLRLSLPLAESHMRRQRVFSLPGAWPDSPSSETISFCSSNEDSSESWQLALARSWSARDTPLETPLTLPSSDFSESHYPQIKVLNDLRRRGSSAQMSQRSETSTHLRPILLPTSNSTLPRPSLSRQCSLSSNRSQQTPVERMQMDRALSWRHQRMNESRAVQVKRNSAISSVNEVSCGQSAAFPDPLRRYSRSTSPDPASKSSEADTKKRANFWSKSKSKIFRKKSNDEKHTVEQSNSVNDVQTRRKSLFGRRSRPLSFIGNVRT